MSRSVRLKDQRAEQRLFGRRLIAMTLIVALCAAALVVRLFYLQVLRYDHFSELSQGNRIRIEPVPPARGLIYDRNGEAIALNRPAYQLELIREQTPDLDATLGRLAELGLLAPAEVGALLQGHWNMVSARVRHGDDDLPDHLAPLLWLPEEPDTEQPDELDVGRDWAFGFFRGVELREAGWDRWLDENDWIDEIFGLLDRLASGEVLGEDPTAPATPISYRERLEIVAGLPGMLADLHHHRIDALTPREPLRRADTPDRNDPCPCGSGKKYKKCCGA